MHLISSECCRRGREEEKKGHSTLLSRQLLRKVRDMVRLVNAMIMSPLSHFFGYGGSSLVRSNAVWHPVARDKAFCNSMVIVLAEASCTGKANQYPEQVPIPVRTKCHPLHHASDPTATKLKLVTSRNGVIRGSAMVSGAG